MSTHTHTHAPDATVIDGRDFRKALGRFPTGVAVVTALDAQGLRLGMTINSFSSVSLVPPIVLWSVAHQAPSYAAFAAARHFVINVLAEDQLAVSNQFSRPSDDKFAGVAWTPGLAGVPVLSGCVATFECAVRELCRAGDHDVMLGDVQRYSHAERTPLAFALSSYARVSAIAA